MQALLEGLMKQRSSNNEISVLSLYRNPKIRFKKNPPPTRGCGLARYDTPRIGFSFEA